MSEEIIQEIVEARAFMRNCLRDARTIAEHLARGVGGREVSLVITKLQEASAWYGLALEELQPKQPKDWPFNPNQQREG